MTAAEVAHLERYYPISRRIGQSLDFNQRNATARSAERSRGTHGHPANPATSDVSYTDEQLEFLSTLAAWQHRHDVRFPSNAQILGVLKSMGYMKVPAGYRLVEIDADDLAMARIDVRDTIPAPHLQTM